MTDALLQELLEARQARRPCVLVTVAATTGSVPREAGAKMLVYANGKASGTRNFPRVHGRRDQPCPTCGTSIVVRMVP